MDVALRLDSQRLAEEVYALIQELDPATWRSDLEANARARVARIRERARDLLERVEAQRSELAFPRFEQALRTLTELRDEAAVRAEERRQAWRATFKQLQPEYAALVKRLRAWQVDLPHVRPTNEWRSLLHVATGVAVLIMVQHVMSPTITLAVGVGLVVSVWTMETTRRFSVSWNDKLLSVLGRFAHSHEWHGVNSATWYTTALLTMVLLFPGWAAMVGVMVLALADPAAATVGRRYGRVKLVHGRSLEGTLTFALVALPTALAVIGVYGPRLAVGQAAWVALAAAVVGAVVELFTGRLDDNFTIPVTVAAAATWAASLLG